MVDHLESRFSSVPLAKAADAVVKLDLENGTEFVDNYKNILELDEEALIAETVVMRNILKMKNLKPCLESFRAQLRADITPNLYKLIQVVISIPISSAGCECSFSAMRRIKTWLRTIHLSILHIENGLVKESISAEAVCEEFAKKNRKLHL